MRKITANILEMVEDGLVDPTRALEELLGWMSEAEVREWAEDDPFWDGFKNELFNDC